MKFQISPKGNLEIIMEPEDREEIEDMVEKYPDDKLFLHELLVEYTGWTGNGMLYSVKPEDIAALTDAPIVTDDLGILDNSDHVVRGRVWWFPQYERDHFGQVLLDHGHVFFTFAPTDDHPEAPKELAST